MLIENYKFDNKDVSFPSEKNCTKSNFFFAKCYSISFNIIIIIIVEMTEAYKVHMI